MRFEAHVYQKNLWSYFNAWELHRKTLRKPFIMFWPRNVNSQSLTQLKALFPTENLSEAQRVIKLRFLLCDPLFLKRIMLSNSERTFALILLKFGMCSKVKVLIYRNWKSGNICSRGDYYVKLWQYLILKNQYQRIINSK